MANRTEYTMMKGLFNMLHSLVYSASYWLRRVRLKKNVLLICSVFSEDAWICVLNNTNVIYGHTHPRTYTLHTVSIFTELAKINV